MNDINFMRLWNFFLLFIQLHEGLSISESDVIDNRQRKLSPTSPCILTLMETQYVQNVQHVSAVDLTALNVSDSSEEDIHYGEEWYCELDEIDAQIIGEPFVRVQGLDESFFENESIVSGEFTLMAPNAWIEHGDMLFPDGLQGEQAEIEPIGIDGGGRRLKSGTKTVLAVRVEGSDTATKASEQTLYNEVFLGNSLKKMYADCSHGEFDLIPYKGNGIQNGVTTVRIPNQVAGSANAVIRNAAVSALNERLGGPAQTKVDYVMLCLPPGTSGGWVAYAFVNGWLSVFNNDWCLKMSVQVHEVGHNLGLPHSGRGGNEYGDQSGMMGLSYGLNDGPRMCFNPSNSWRLGWYSGQRAVFNGSRDSITYSIVGVVDYDASDPSKRVVVRVESGRPANFFIGFNRARGFNSETRMARDQVVIVEAEDGYKTSNLMGILAVGNQRRLVQNYRGTGKDLVVHYRQNNGGDVAIVDVFLRSNGPPSPTPQPTPRPTRLPTGRPTPNPISASGSCGSDTASFVLRIMTDRYPEDTSWRLNSRLGTVEGSGGNYGGKAEQLLQMPRICLARNRWYDFSILDAFGDALCCEWGNGWYAATLDGKEIFRGSSGFKYQADHTFRVPGA
ncbi:gametolysin peptidase M11 [Nitzschia inconspicua]|uniref:Gametolysin peptidase M11 n=1 Tax=Nitzschia inconspicua TaxID=303405 RepID=A0A9K3L0F6_9STRA|nr:gametolysin peptidase M11 [Nitzschia inconspicua]KAG7359530.1 gametolysin peptidase M11 [Nitzschia inconspicua]